MTYAKPASALGYLGLDQTVRGVGGGDDLTPISAAVVIGIGGSGIQTISRVRAALRGQRPDQAAIDSIKFLGIDAVDLGDQNPPLPQGVGLGVGEFFNLVEVPFDANRYLQGQLPHNQFLNEWWDPAYRVPMGPITEGLKRERMLGRLAFHRGSDELVRRIETSITEAVKIDGALGSGGESPGVPTIPVYIVNSSTGGTGSSGFLTVVLAAWAAARGRGYYPEIRAFTYLPSTFRAAINRTVGSGDLAVAHDSNAYAYFREVDHFTRHGSTLGTYLGRSAESGGPDIPDRDLLKQIYLVGSTMRGIGELTRINDLYEITAEAIYHFLVTDIGMPMVGVDSTNTDRALGEEDDFRRSRRYCSLGVARVVFPGDTYRRHLTHRYIDWYVNQGLLEHAEDLRGIARSHELTHRLIDAATSVGIETQSVEFDDEVLDFLDYAEQGMAEMERTADVQTAQKLIGSIKRSAPSVVRSIRKSTEEQHRRLAAEFDQRVVESVFTSGHGVLFAGEILQLLERHLSTMQYEAEASLQTTTAGRVSAEARVNQLVQNLQKASNRALHEKVAAKIASLTGTPSTEEDIATLLGQSIQSWARAIHDAELAAARNSLATEMFERVGTLRLELDRSVTRLRAISDDAKARWTDDTLVGKDAGPEATTTLIPADSQPEIEESTLARSLFEDIKKEHYSGLQGEDLNTFIKRWADDRANRAFFSLGSSDPAEQSAAEKSLTLALVEEARRRALETGEGVLRKNRLPSDLPSAETEPLQLARAFSGLAVLSRSICWSWEEGRFRAGTARTPTVTTVIAHPEGLADQIKGSLPPNTKLHPIPDPERVVALSVEWAVPVHALHDVVNWKAAYEMVSQRREAAPYSHPPVHIDRRFAEKLETLVPLYFEVEDVARLVGQALIIKDLLGDESTGLEEFYDHSRTNPVVAHLRVDDDGGWLGRQLDFRDGRARAIGDDIPLGESWPSMLEAVGDNHGLRTSIEAAAKWAKRCLGVERLLEEVDDFMETKLEALIDANTQRPKDVEVLEHVFDGLASWQVELRQQAILS